MMSGAQYAVRELVREPVKEAVREALREEADVQAREDATPQLDRSSDDRTGSDDSGGPGIGLLLVGLVAALGATYLFRKRGSESEQSTWSEFEDESPGSETREPGQTSTGSRDTTVGESSASTTTSE